jgi:hypothetical protein
MSPDQQRKLPVAVKVVACPFFTLTLVLTLFPSLVTLPDPFWLTFTSQPIWSLNDETYQAVWFSVSALFSVDVPVTYPYESMTLGEEKYPTRMPLGYAMIVRKSALYIPTHLYPYE